jgi:hypothetical protein
VLAEILNDKIFLDTTGSLRVTGEHQSSGGPPELDLNAL